MEETISLKEIFSVLKKRLMLIVLLVVGAILVSAIVSYFIITPTYQPVRNLSLIKIQMKIMQ